MRYLATIFQGPNWTTHRSAEQAETHALSEKNRPLAPGLYAIFEQKNPFPLAGTDWIFLPETECTAAAAALEQAPNTPATPALTEEYRRALAGLARMKALITIPHPSEFEKKDAPAPSL